VPELAASGLRVIDMSGAFRMQDAALYPKWYGFEHTATDLLQQSVYGMPELFAESIRKAQVVANPGCYATSVILPLSPLYKEGVISPHSFVVVDGKSGVVRRRRHPKLETHFCEVNEKPVGHTVCFAIVIHLKCFPACRRLWQKTSYSRPSDSDYARDPVDDVFQHQEGTSARAVLTDTYAKSQFVNIRPKDRCRTFMESFIPMNATSESQHRARRQSSFPPSTTS
jgi:N-acetyl-gamma-glutamylphosphate reductase